MTAKILDFKTGKPVRSNDPICSFCKTPESQVTKMFSNQQNKYVCGGCIKKFSEYIHG